MCQGPIGIGAPQEMWLPRHQPCTNDRTKSCTNPKVSKSGHATAKGSVGADAHMKGAVTAIQQAPIQTHQAPIQIDTPGTPEH